MTLISSDLHDVFLAMLHEQNVPEPEITEHGDYLFSMLTRLGAVQVTATEEDGTPTLGLRSVIIVRNLSAAGHVICSAKFTNTDPRLIAAHVLAYLT